VHPNQWAKRLRIARGFAAYLQTIDPTVEIPPPDVFPTRRQRATPYLFSQQDICGLLTAARQLHHPLHAASYETLFGLLAVSGMRIGEAVALEREDVDLDAGLITIRKAKSDRRWRAWSLYGDLGRRDVLATALEAVIQNAGAPGIDAPTTSSNKSVRTT